MASYYKTVDDIQFGFVNPYNFVPVANYKVKTTPDTEGEKFSGKISCKIITKTPLSIPDVAQKEMDTDEKEHFKYPFMSINGKYFIPGSSIRGMIRNVYETITDSCFSTIGDKELIATRVGTRQAYKPALLIRENDEWKLYKAKKYMLNVSPRYLFTTTAGTAYDCNNNDKTIIVNNVVVHSGDSIWFSQCKDEYKNSRGISCGYAINRLSLHETSTESRKGILYIGEQILNKHHESVFEKDTIINISSDMINRAMRGLEETHKQYNDKTLNSNLDTSDDKKRHYGYPEYNKMKSNGIIPIWYDDASLINNKLYLSFAALGRKAYYNTVNSVIDKKNRCTDFNNMCDACSLFGMIFNEGAISSHIRFTDALCDTPEKIGNYLTLAELSSPRPAYLNFYTEGGKDYDCNGMVIRGRKYYWHSRNYSIINKNILKTKRNATVQIAKQGTEFAFDIFYEKVNLSQLKKLIWALNLGENKDEGTQCHKLGHGKPLGLGSVKIVVKDILSRSYQDGRYMFKKLPIDFESILNNQNSDTVKALLRITDIKNNYNVMYPYVVVSTKNTSDNVHASHQWFTHNKMDDRNNHTINQLLPKLTSPQEPILKPIEVIGEYNKVQPTHTGGRCKKCGKPVGQKDGVPYEYCYNCRPQKKN